MPGYEPFLLCDFHVHTQWSDGRLSVREVVDLYGQTGRFDVIAITDHILMDRDLFARAGRSPRSASSSSRVTQDRFQAYLADIAAEARARAGALRSAGHPGRGDHPEPFPQPEELAHRRAEHHRLHQRRPDGGRDPAGDPPAGRVSIACHPHHRTTRRIEVSTCYLWDNRKTLVEFVDVWEAANRDDLFSVTSLKHYPYVANSDFHKAKHLYSWKTLLRCEKNWEAVAAALRANVDVALTLYRNGSWAA